MEEVNENWKVGLITAACVGLVLGGLAYKKMRPKRMTVKELYVYPIKSCKGIRLNKATLDDFGFEHDRQWVIVNEKNEFIHQRKYPKLAVVEPSISSEYLTVTAPGKPALKIPLKHDADYTDDEVRKVSVWGQENPGIDEGEEAANWFSEYLGFTARLIRRYDAKYHRELPDESKKNNKDNLDELPNKVSWVDEHPILIISKASLRELNRRLLDQGKKAIKMNRFRPNIIIDDEENNDPKNDYYVNTNRSFFSTLFFWKVEHSSHRRSLEKD